MCSKCLAIKVEDISNISGNKQIKAKIAKKKAELAEITNGGAWVLIIVGIITAIIVIGLVLIIIGLVIMHNNHNKTAELTAEIAELESQLT